METIFLNYSFKMKFLPSKKIQHSDGLSRLIPKTREPLEETVIALLSSEMDIKMFCITQLKNYQLLWKK